MPIGLERYGKTHSLAVKKCGCIQNLGYFHQDADSESPRYRLQAGTRQLVSADMIKVNRSYGLLVPLHGMRRKMGTAASDHPEWYTGKLAESITRLGSIAEEDKKAACKTKRCESGCT